MKLSKKYISFLLPFLMAGCLDVDLVDRVEKDKFYKTEVQALEAIQGVYGTLTDYNYHKTNWPLILPTYEDVMFSTGVSVPATVSNNTHTSNAGPCVDFWRTLYAGINNANDVLKNVPDIEFARENDKNRILAEAHFLRALFHYDLVRLYGGANGIPVITSPTTGIENAYHAQQPKDSVYKQIIADFTFAAGKNEDGTTRLPLRNDPDYIQGRATNGAAHAFLAEVYLTLGEWQKAVDEADTVISSNQYEFLDDYAKLWDVTFEKEAQKEQIFSVAFFRDNGAATGNSLGSNIAQLYNPAGVMPGGGFLCGNPYGKGAGNFKVQKWFIQFYQDDTDHLGYSDPDVDASKDENNLIAKDYRIETSFWRTFQQKNNTTGELGSIVTCYPAAGGQKQENWGYIKKFIDPQGLDNRTNENDMPRLRLSDMYLIKAEALNELGDYQEACNAIDKVRERVRKANGMERAWPKYISMDKADNIGRVLTQEEFRWLVFMERGLEFAGEQKRWFDLVRMKHDANTSMYDYMMNTYIPSLPASVVNKQCVMAERKKYFPIPFNEISRNDSIKQNPGY